MIQYALSKNGMNLNADEYLAVVISSKKVDINDIIDFMVAEGTGLTRPQAMAYFEKLEQTIEYFVKEGATITTPLFRTRTFISGMFRNEQDTFDASRHQVNVRLSAGTRLNQLESQLAIKKISRQTVVPQPKVFLDMQAQLKNEKIIPGHIACITGRYLKLNPEDPFQGVFFIPVNRPKKEIRVNVYYKSQPSELLFQVPTMPSGRYTVVVKAVLRHHKSIRQGKLPVVLQCMDTEL